MVGQEEFQMGRTGVLAPKMSPIIAGMSLRDGMVGMGLSFLTPLLYYDIYDFAEADDVVVMYRVIPGDFCW